MSYSPLTVGRVWIKMISLSKCLFVCRLIDALRYFPHSPILTFLRNFDFTECYRYPYQPDQSKYYEENHGFNITRSCAPGTWFDQNTCSCSITSGLNSGNIQGKIIYKFMTSGSILYIYSMSTYIYQYFNVYLTLP